MRMMQSNLITLTSKAYEVEDFAAAQELYHSSGWTDGLPVVPPTESAGTACLPATVDNALYDAFGQRIISTIYTQSNQYRVIMEVDPSMQKSLDTLSKSICPRRPRPATARCRCRPSYTSSSIPGRDR